LNRSRINVPKPRYAYSLIAPQRRGGYFQGLVSETENALSGGSGVSEGWIPERGV